MSSSIHDSLESIENKDIQSPHLIPISRFNKRSNKTTKLIGNESAENYIKGQHREYKLLLEEPLFVHSIHVETEGYIDYKTADFFWSSLSGGRAKKEAKKNKNDVFAIRVNDFVQDFCFKPSKQYTGETLIKKITVYGLSAFEFERALSDAGDLDSYRDELLIAAQEKVDEFDKINENLKVLELKEGELNDKISLLEESKEEIENSIVSSEKKQAEIVSDINRRNSEESEIKLRVAQLDDDIDTKKKQRESLNQEIVNKERELKNLQNDVNLFPTEISGFVSQGARNISRYTVLAFLPILILVYVTFYVFNNAAAFLQAYSVVTTENMIAVFLSRLPFAMVALGIAGASYKIAKIFISEIIKINTQRLNLSKISIIAKDVSEASEQGLDMDEEQLYSLRTKLKMELLRSHLKSYVEDEYYNKSALRKIEGFDEEGEE